MSFKTKFKIGLLVTFLVSCVCLYFSFDSLRGEKELSTLETYQAIIDELNSNEDVVVEKKTIKSFITGLLNHKPIAILSIIGIFLSLAIYGFMSQEEDRCPTCGTLARNRYGNSYKSAFCPSCGMKRR